LAPRCLLGLDDRAWTEHVEGITKSVALEIAKSKIRVNGVAPGPTDTGMLTHLTGTPENKAALATVFRWVASASRRSLPT
jgi:NAD(P)-dependent dehydrogenase (short-subunit alcohol dehydrogenase family)